MVYIVTSFETYVAAGILIALVSHWKWIQQRLLAYMGALQTSIGPIPLVIGSNVKKSYAMAQGNLLMESYVESGAGHLSPKSKLMIGIVLALFSGIRHIQTVPFLSWQQMKCYCN